MLEALRADGADSRLVFPGSRKPELLLKPETEKVGHNRRKAREIGNGQLM